MSYFTPFVGILLTKDEDLEVNRSFEERSGCRSLFFIMDCLTYLKLPCIGVEIKNSYSNKNTGTYATTYYTTKQSARIICYKSFKNTSAANKRETVVHEVGHTLGLSHTQSKNNSVSVMRALNFNQKAYPLADDKKGINAKY